MIGEQGDRETVPLVIKPPVVQPAALQARDPSARTPHPRMTHSAGRTTQPVAAPHCPGLEWQPVRASLVGDPEIPAGKAPLRAMRCQTAPAVTILSEQVRQFMKKGTGNLLVRNFLQGGIQPDLLTEGDRHTRRGSHPRIPANDDFWRQSGCNRHQCRPGTPFEIRIPLFGSPCLRGTRRSLPSLPTVTRGGEQKLQLIQ